MHTILETPRLVLREMTEDDFPRAVPHSVRRADHVRL